MRKPVWYPWVVVSGRKRGQTVLSHHLKKSAAIKSMKRFEKRGKRCRVVKASLY